MRYLQDQLDLESDEFSDVWVRRTGSEHYPFETMRFPAKITEGHAEASNSSVLADALLPGEIRFDDIDDLRPYDPGHYQPWEYKVKGENGEVTTHWGNDPAEGSPEYHAEKARQRDQWLYRVNRIISAKLLYDTIQTIGWYEHTSDWDWNIQVDVEGGVGTPRLCTFGAWHTPQGAPEDEEDEDAGGYYCDDFEILTDEGKGVGLADPDGETDPAKFTKLRLDLYHDSESIPVEVQIKDIVAIRFGYDT